MPQEKVRVLVVEDDALVGEMIRGLLEDSGYTVVGEAGNGQQAVELTEALRPDVVLMDVEMPGMDGIEATRRIQESCPTPVVLLTAYETSDLVQRASAAGAGAYLVKPSNAREMERAITIALARFDDLMALRRMNDELDAFAHTVAHDLKNPLTPIIGYAEVLTKQYATLPEAEIQKCLRSIVQSGRRMRNIVDELLLLAGVRRQAVEYEPLDMATLVAEALQRMGDTLENSQAQVSTPKEWPAAVGYGPWIVEVWVNYLSNAIQYGGRPPRVELGFSILDCARSVRIADRAVPAGKSDIRHPTSAIQFWVRDNGPGIAPEDQARLFTPFTRLEQVEVKGHGLGLSIVRRIVEKLGGQVGVESQVGQGSTFYFTLPAAPVRHYGMPS